ncbi:MAG TPA: hypothetical protein VNJ01_16645 [Bacteriovoracaceae bacterium]|nr:hypothetical protein [Bacteriovoracaceae bacterium]
MRFWLSSLLLLTSLSAWGQAATAPTPPVQPKAVPAGTPPPARIYLISDMTLWGLEWGELGLSDKSNFLAPLEEVWLKWLNENLPPSVTEAVLCKAQCLEYYKGWLERPETELPLDSDEYASGLWLGLSFDLRKLSHLAATNDWKFEWDGRLVLMDVKTKRSIGNAVISKETEDWKGLGQKQLNSALASRLYRSAVGQLGSVVRKDRPLPKHDHVNSLTIKGNKTILELFVLMEKLHKEGQNISLRSQLDAFTKKEASLICFYQGEEKMFTDLLSQLKELKSSVRYKLVHQLDGKNHALSFTANE